MKFSEFNEHQWEELGMYLDTCVIPITGLTGTENPVECIAKLSDLQTIIDSIEKHYRGRVVVYPAFHYISEESMDSIATVIRDLKSTLFKHVVVISAQLDINSMGKCGADLCVSSIETTEIDGEIKNQILQLWK